MTIQIKLNSAGATVEIEGYNRVEELLDSKSNTVGKIGNSMSYFLTMFAYIEIINSGKAPRHIVEAFMKADTKFPKESSLTEDIHGIDEEVLRLLDDEEFKLKYDPFIDGCLTEAMALFASGAVGCCTDEVSVFENGSEETKDIRA